MSPILAFEISGSFLGRSRPSLIEAEVGNFLVSQGESPFWGVRAPASLKLRLTQPEYVWDGTFLGRSRPSLIEAVPGYGRPARKHCFLGRSRPSLIEAAIRSVTAPRSRTFWGVRAPASLKQVYIDGKHCRGDGLSGAFAPQPH